MGARMAEASWLPAKQRVLEVVGTLLEEISRPMLVEIVLRSPQREQTEVDGVWLRPGMMAHDVSKRLGFAFRRMPPSFEGEIALRVDGQLAKAVVPVSVVGALPCDPVDATRQHIRNRERLINNLMDHMLEMFEASGSVIHASAQAIRAASGQPLPPVERPATWPTVLAEAAARAMDSAFGAQPADANAQHGASATGEGRGPSQRRFESRLSVEGLKHDPVPRDWSGIDEAYHALDDEDCTMPDDDDPEHLEDDGQEEDVDDEGVEAECGDDGRDVPPPSDTPPAMDDRQGRGTIG